MNQSGQALLLAFLIQSLVSGCAYQHPTCGTEALAALPAEPLSVWVAEPELAKKIAIRSKKVEEGPNGAILARVQIENISHEALQIECQTLYKNNAGWTLNTSAWVRYDLKPGKKVWLMAPTIAPGTARFFMQIQPAPLLTHRR